MNIVRLIILLIVPWMLVSPAYAAPKPPDAEEIDVEGSITSYEDGVLTVAGISFVVNDATLIITGRGKGVAASLEGTDGVWASVSGYTDADGLVIARKVKVKPWEQSAPDPEDALEDEDAEKDENKHPVAVWMASRFGTSYDALLAMHEAGIGWGVMVKAFYLAQANDQGVSAGELIDRHLEGEGWGTIVRELGTYPGKFVPAWGHIKPRNPNAAPKD